MDNATAMQRLQDVLKDYPATDAGDHPCESAAKVIRRLDADLRAAQEANAANRKYAQGVVAELKKKLEDVEKAVTVPAEPPKTVTRWAGHVLYNCGFGPEYLNLEPVAAETFEEAQGQAKAQADRRLGEGKWEDVRVRPDPQA